MTNAPPSRMVKVRIGDWTDEDGDRLRLVVEARLYLSTPEGRTHQTVNHGSITDPWRLSLMGDVRRLSNGRWTYDSTGQVHRYLPEVTDFAAPGENGAGLGWDAGRRDALHRIWQDWHLNDCRAACSHMPPDAHARWEAREKVVCPETGYEYGSAWLVKPLTGEVLIALAGMFGPAFVEGVEPWQQ